MAKKHRSLPIWDKRMLEVAQHCVDNGTCRSRAAFLESIGFLPMNANQLLTGKQSFRIHHIYAAAQMYGINVNWIFGLEKDMLRGEVKVAVALLKKALLKVK
jgi:hypothetical protein